jgi:hypothetical protein
VTVQPTLFDADPHIARGATLDGPGDCYRYDLWRRRGAGGRVVNFVLLNPSTADSTIDDPTVRRCMGYARAWGYSDLVLTNLYAWRATSPVDLLLRPHAEAIGPENEDYLRRWAREAALVVCGWGAHGAHKGRGICVLEMLREAGAVPHCLARTKGCQPQHPLYLRADLVPVAMEE